MECPKCNNGMVQGFIQSARDIFWSTKKHEMWFAANKRKEEILVTSGSTAYVKEAFYCPKCGTIVILSQE